MTEHIKECGSVNAMNAGGPPTTVEYIAFHNSANFSAALNTCCAGHTAAYGVGGIPDDCYIYCNVTAPATISSIKTCMRKQLGNNTDGESVYISTQGNEGKENSAVAWTTKSGVMGYLVLILGVSAAFCGLL
jgi:hypothetical protein